MSSANDGKDGAHWRADEEWTLLQVTGPDRADFFHRLTTNRVPAVGDPLVHSFFLNVSARVLAEFWIGAEQESLSLFVPLSQKEAAKENIDRYLFGEKLQVIEPDGSLFMVWDASGEVLEQLAPLSAYAAHPDPRYGPGTSWLFVETGQRQAFTTKASELAAPLSEAMAEQRRLQLGRPRVGWDYQEDTLFLEIAQQDDFSETKGCYPGQEIVARVLHRGRLQRHLRGFESAERVAAGWSYSQDGKEMARVTSAVALPEGGSRGLLMVRREVADEGTSLEGLHEDGSSARLTVRPRPLELANGDDG